MRSRLTLMVLLVSTIVFIAVAFDPRHPLRDRQPSLVSVTRSAASGSMIIRDVSATDYPYYKRDWYKRAIAAHARRQPFDPTAAPAPDVTQPLEQRQVGGLGIFLARELMDGMAYERKSGHNILTMTKNTKQ